MLNRVAICNKEYFDIRQSIVNAPDYQQSITTQTNATKQKNRYRDVLPYERTRVRVRTPSSDLAGDYINANYIFENEYIACCAPLPNTIYDFWSMVWHENVQVVLMLTNFVERNMVHTSI